jgi:hypothetical protein
MINRYSQRRIYPQFQPTSFEEYAYLPLAYQQAEDQLYTAAQSQQVYQDALTKDIAARDKYQTEINQGINAITDELNRKGYNSSLRNQLIDLKRKRDDLMNPGGALYQIGQNYQAYNNYAKELMSNDKILRDDRQLALQKSLQDYKGYESGNFNGFTPSDYQDVQKIALDLAKDIPQQSIETSTGWERTEQIDPTTGDYIWYKNGQTVKGIPSEVTDFVVKNYLQNSPEVVSYLRDSAYLRGTDPEQYMNSQLQNAVNTALVRNSPKSVSLDRDMRFQGSPFFVDMMKREEALKAQGWSPLTMSNVPLPASQTMNTLDSPEFINGQLVEPIVSKDPVGKMSESFTAGLPGATTDKGLVKAKDKFKQQRQMINQVRNSDPILRGKSDQEVWNAISQAEQKLTQGYGQVWRPTNSNMEYETERILGTKDGKVGDISMRSISVNGKKYSPTNIDQAAEELGYDDASELYAALQETGQIAGITMIGPTPGSYVANLKNSDGELSTVFIENDDNIKTNTSLSHKLLQNTLQGKRFEEEPTNQRGVSLYYVNELNPASDGTYEYVPYVVEAKSGLSKNQVLNLPKEEKQKVGLNEIQQREMNKVKSYYTPMFLDNKQK